MKRSKKEVQAAFGLAELPDDEFMELLAEVGEGDVVVGPKGSDDDAYTPEEIEEELREALIASSVGDLLKKARAKRKRSLRDVGKSLGVSHARVQQLEASENVELSTLVRAAGALGYGVKIVLESEEPEEKELLTADLSELAHTF